MRKRLQNKIAESKLALPVMLVYATGIWLIYGLFQKQLWLQFSCFLLSTYLIILLNNVNALIRIYSRMVSCSFIALTCCASFLFPSTPQAFVQLCFIGFLFFLFLTCQDKQAMGFTYYGYLLLGIASLFFVKILLLLPLLWILMATEMHSLSWRTWMASLFGLTTPYWFGICLLIWANDFSLLISHFTMLLNFQVSSDANWTIGQTALYIFIITLSVMGFIHYIRNLSHDKIRIRLIYGFLLWLDLFIAVILFLQPQHYDPLIRFMIILTAPSIAHLLALTSTKATNIMFYIITAITLIITSYNIWTF